VRVDKLKYVAGMFHASYLMFKALFAWASLKTYIPSKIINPIGQITFFVLLGYVARDQNYEGIPYYVMGIAMHVVCLNGIHGVSKMIQGERIQGTLIYYFFLPVNRAVSIMNRVFFNVLDGVVGVIIGLCWANIFFDMNFSGVNLLILGLTLLIASFTTAGLGLLLGSYSLLVREYDGYFEGIIYYLLYLTSGSILSISVLPKWVDVINDYLPLTNSVIAARIIYSGGSIYEVLPYWANEIFIGILLIVLGYFSLRYIEYLARRKGSLDFI
jgi:ABC-2 type transport system permease protein